MLDLAWNSDALPVIRWFGECKCHHTGIFSLGCIHSWLFTAEFLFGLIKCMLSHLFSYSADVPVLSINDSWSYPRVSRHRLGWCTKS